MKNILVIGAGQLGSRHLQAIKAVQAESLNIMVVDPNEESLEIAKERYEQVENNIHEIHFAKSLHDLPVKDLYFCVVATTSNIRAKVTIDLIKNFSVKNLLLEKILFDTESQYKEVQSLLEETNTNCWVNCCMRMQSVYHNLINEFKDDTFTYNVSGSNFGNITNAIHYIDHACSLAGTSQFKLNTENLSNSIIESKRKNFIEINGHLSAKFENNSIINISCFENGELPVMIEVQSQKVRYVFKENENKYFKSSIDTDWRWEEHTLGLLFQSQLTKNLIEQFLNEGEILLPKFEESKTIHLNLLNPIRSYLSTINENISVDYPFT